MYRNDKSPWLNELNLSVMSKMDPFVPSFFTNHRQRRDLSQAYSSMRSGRGYARIATTLVIAVECALGCSHPRVPLPSLRANAGPCLIKVTKLQDGNVRLTVANVNGPDIVLQRHGERWGTLFFEVSGLSEKWSRLDPVDANSADDFPDPADRDWTSLTAGDQASWFVNYNDVGKLYAGEKVRLLWKTTGPMPPCLSKSGSRFPDALLDLVLTVES